MRVSSNCLIVIALLATTLAGCNVRGQRGGVAGCLPGKARVARLVTTSRVNYRALPRTRGTAECDCYACRSKRDGESATYEIAEPQSQDINATTSEGVFELMNILPTVQNNIHAPVADQPINQTIQGMIIEAPSPETESSVNSASDADLNDSSSDSADDGQIPLLDTNLDNQTETPSLDSASKNSEGFESTSAQAFSRTPSSRSQPISILDPSVAPTATQPAVKTKVETNVESNPEPTNEPEVAAPAPVIQSDDIPFEMVPTNEMASRKMESTAVVLKARPVENYRLYNGHSHHAPVRQAQLPGTRLYGTGSAETTGRFAPPRTYFQQLPPISQRLPEPAPANLELMSLPALDQPDDVRLQGAPAAGDQINTARLIQKSESTLVLQAVANGGSLPSHPVASIMKTPTKQHGDVDQPTRILHADASPANQQNATALKLLPLFKVDSITRQAIEQSSGRTIER